MPPKRKANPLDTSKDRDAAAKKRRRQPKPTIQWALARDIPTSRVFTRSVQRRFARPLFGLSYEELVNTQRENLQNAPIGSPTLRARAPKRQDEIDQAISVALEQNQSSDNLQTMIQWCFDMRDDSDGAQRAFENAFRRRTREHFLLAWVAASDDEDDDESTVYSFEYGLYDRSVHVAVDVYSDPPTRQLFDFIRVQANDTNFPFYFIIVDPNNTVRINGQTFTNNGGADGDQVLYIGPLASFATIEFYGQTLLYWRHPEDLEYRTAGRRPTQRELAHRKGNRYPDISDTLLHVDLSSDTEEDTDEVAYGEDGELDEEGELDEDGEEVQEDNDIEEEKAIEVEDEDVEEDKKEEEKKGEEEAIEEVEEMEQETAEDEESEVENADSSASRSLGHLPDPRISDPDALEHELPRDGLPDETELRGSADSAKAAQDLELLRNNPCRYLREKLKDIRKDYADTNHDQTIVSHEDLFNAITAIGQAISEEQDESGGFAAIAWDDVHGTVASDAVRPGRLLLVPWRDSNHTLLLAVQLKVENRSIASLDEQGVAIRPERLSLSRTVQLLAINSATWMVTREQREQLFVKTLDLVEKTHWNRENITIQDDLTMVETAQQINNTEEQSIAYTAANAWSIFLGLQTNRAFMPTLRFCEEAREIIFLSLKGIPDWRLIWAFLRCHDFVEGNEEPGTDRKFPASIPYNHLGRHRGKMRIEDNENYTKSIPLMSTRTNYGFRHGEGHQMGIASDSWTQNDRLVRAPQLQARGVFNRSISRAVLRQRWKDMTSKLVLPQQIDPADPRSSMSDMRDRLIRRGEEPGSSDRSCFERFANAFRVAGQYQLKFLDANICQYASSRIDTSSKLSRVLVSHYNPNIEFRDLDVLMAINAVTEAITTFQDENTELGGFALTTQANVDLAMETISSKAQPYIVRPRRPWLLPFPVRSKPHGAGTLEQFDRTILAIIQEERSGTSSRFVAHLADSSPSVGEDVTSIYAKIQQLARKIGWSTYCNEKDEVDFADAFGMVDSLRYRPSDNFNQRRMLTILTGWAYALGLTIDPKTHFDGFKIKPQFWSRAQSLIHSAMNGVVDWSTIAAFLMCHKLVMEQSIQAVPEERRFTHTSLCIHSRDVATRLSKFRKADQELERAYREGGKLPYDSSNNVTPDSGPRKVPDTHPREEFKLDTNLWIIKNHCNYVSNSLANLKKRDDVSKWLEAMENTDLNKDFKVQIFLDEVLLAIASVTMAITRSQGLRGGFSILEELAIQGFTSGEDNLGLPAIRFGRPMLIPVPIYAYSHFVLLVIQRNDEGEPTITVVDSMNYQLKADGRQFVYDFASKVIRKSGWARHVLPSIELPPHASFIPAAQQHNEWMCGYFVVLNAWSLALGLELNPDFVPPAEEERLAEFHNEVKEMIFLARGGFLDCQMIYAWLVCKDFVTRTVPTVPRLRRFHNTERFTQEGLAGTRELQERIKSLAGAEDEYWSSQDHPDYSGLEQWTDVVLAEGRSHDAAFPWDDWNEHTQQQIVPHLSEAGRLNTSLSNARLRDEYISVLDPGNVSRAFDQHMQNETRKDDWELVISDNDMARLILEFLRTDNDPEVQRKHLDLVRKDPCLFFRRDLNNMRRFHKDFHDWLKGFKKPAPLNELMRGEQVDLAIAAVIDVINNLQPGHNGGFAYSTQAQISPASSEAWDPEFCVGAPVVVHPRRCWLLPFVVAGEFKANLIHHLAHQKGISGDEIESWGDDGHGHIFLAVLQQYQGTSPKFRAFFLDSAPWVFKDHDVMEYIYQRITSAAARLGWSTHRNTTNIRFSRTWREVSVANQRGGSSCGLHTILNAWIIGLGLHPDPDSKFGDALYTELHELVTWALSGTLDWLTLIAWLLCRGLVQETSPDAVPEDRRFTRTQSYMDDQQLHNTIRNTHVAQNMFLELQPESVAPYDFSCNADFDEDSLKKRTTQYGDYSQCESDIMTIGDDSDEVTDGLHLSEDEIEVGDWLSEDDLEQWPGVSEDDDDVLEYEDEEAPAGEEELDDSDALERYDHDSVHIEDDMISWDSLFEAIDSQESRLQTFRNNTRKWILTASHA